MNRSIQLISIFSIVCISSTNFSADQQSLPAGQLTKAAATLAEAVAAEAGVAWSSVMRYWDKNVGNGQTQLDDVLKTKEVSARIESATKEIEKGILPQDLPILIKQSYERTASLGKTAAVYFNQGNTDGLVSLLSEPTVFFSNPPIKSFILARLRAVNHKIVDHIEEPEKQKELNYEVSEEKKFTDLTQTAHWWADSIAIGEKKITEKEFKLLVDAVVIQSQKNTSAALDALMNGNFEQMKKLQEKHFVPFANPLLLELMDAVLISHAKTQSNPPPK